MIALINITLINIFFRLISMFDFRGWLLIIVIFDKIVFILSNQLLNIHMFLFAIVTYKIFLLKMKPMSNSKLLQTNNVSALAFSIKGDYCVVATKKDHTAHLFRVNTLANIDSWQLIQKFTQHTQTIGDIDWAQDNKIITSSHDRSVIVWKQVSQSKWQKMLVNIDVRLSILVSKWAPSGRKFALGSSCSTLAVGYYNVIENCWVVSKSKNLTKSPITTVSFHPSCNILAFGSADFSIKIVTASFKQIKEDYIIQSKVEDYPYEGPFAGVNSLFEVLFSIENLGGWVNYLSFQNNGSNLLIIAHTNHVKVLDIAEGKVVVGEEDIKWNGLPFISGFINKNKELLLGGYDKKVARFVKKGNFVFEGYLDKNEKSNAIKAKKGIVAHMTKGIQKKEFMFGQGPSESDHINTINVIQVGTTPVSYDLNGLVHFWN